MIKRQIITLFFPLFLVTNIASAESLTQTISSSLLNNGSLNLDLNNLLGGLTAGLPISLKCSVPSVPSFLNTNDLDLCQVTNKLKGLDNLSFNLPICNFSYTSNLDLNILDTISSQCNTNMSSLSNNELLQQIDGLEGIVKNSNENYSFYSTKTSCGNTQSSNSNYSSASDNYFKQLVANTDNYNALFTGVGNTQRNCVEILTKEGASQEQIISKCSQASLYKSIPGQETEVQIDQKKEDVVKNIGKRVSIFDPEESRNAEKSLRQKFLSKCSNKTTVADIKACEEKVLDEDEKIATKKATTQKEIDIQTSLYDEALQKSTEQEYMFNYPTNDIKENLPANMRKDYTFFSKRYLAQQTLLKNLKYELNELKKELSDLIYQKREACAKPFYSSVYKADLEKTMKNIKAE